MIDRCLHLLGKTTCLLLATGAAGCAHQPKVDCTFACRTTGDCTLLDGVCRVTSDADCAASSRCKDFGTCHAQEGRCVALTAEDCRQRSTACSHDGMCEVRQGSCVATRADDCRNSLFCSRSGKCSLENGQCLATADADCAGSEVCKTEGRCVALGWQCRKPGEKVPEGPGMRRYSCEELERMYQATGRGPRCAPE